MGARSRRKGSRTEREVARLLAEWLGGTWSRVPLSGGWGARRSFGTSGDIITSLPGFPFTIECKACEGWHLEQLFTAPDRCALAGFWRQTRRQASEAGKRPLLVFTRNFQPLYAMLRADDRIHAFGDGAPPTSALTAQIEGEPVVVVHFYALRPGFQALYSPGGTEPRSSAALAPA